MGGRGLRSTWLSLRANISGRWETGRLGCSGGPRLSSEHSAVLCQAVPVACLLFLQDFFPCSLEEGPPLVPRNKHCPIRCLPLLGLFLFLFLPWRQALWSCFPLRISTFSKVRAHCRSCPWAGGGREGGGRERRRKERKKESKLEKEEGS